VPDVVDLMKRKKFPKTPAFALSILCALALSATISSANDGKAVLTLIYEARGEADEGMSLVASVIKTRAYIKGTTPEQIVLAPHQFSCFNPKTHRPTQKHVPTSKEIERASRIWNSSSIGIYTNYFAVSVHPKWADQCKNRKRVGNHIFCTLKNF
jgi:spore germination cell wall hydrolase CwlJ-like protein